MSIEASQIQKTLYSYAAILNFTPSPQGLRAKFGACSVQNAQLFFPRSQSISILLYTECQKRRKVPQINQTCVKRITFYLTWLREALWICYLPVNKSNVHRLATLPGRQ